MDNALEKGLNVLGILGMLQAAFTLIVGILFTLGLIFGQPVAER